MGLVKILVARNGTLGQKNIKSDKWSCQDGGWMATRRRMDGD